MRVEPESVGGSHADISRERLTQQDGDSRRGSIMSTQTFPESGPLPVLPTLANEKIIASGNGITVAIAQAEPVIFLEDADSGDSSKAAMLRGHLHIKVTKTTKIKRILLTFKGVVNATWSESLPSQKHFYRDSRGVMTHIWPFYNDRYITQQNRYGADYFRLLHPKKGAPTYPTSGLFPRSRSSVSLDRMAKEFRRLSLPHSSSRSFTSDEFAAPSTSAQTGYTLFQPGDYIYNFELPIDSHFPETIKTDYGSVKYSLEAFVERAGVFRPNISGSKEVLLVRTPSQNSLEQVEPIAISRSWEDQLHYDIIISGKSFPLGAQIPIAFKLTPLAKVSCHRIKVYVSETALHWSLGNVEHRTDKNRQILLFDKRAGFPVISTYPGSKLRITSGGGIRWEDREAAARGVEISDPMCTNLLGDVESDFGAGPTEMEFDVQLPTCPLMRNVESAQKLHCDSAYDNITINHWIRIVLRLSRPDENYSHKRRHFEISIDSPFHILSCLAKQSNLALPHYTSPTSAPSAEYECGCPDARPLAPPTSMNTGLGDLNMILNISNASDGSPIYTPQSSSSESVDRAREDTQPTDSGDSLNMRTRPIHLIRVPSFAPPPFEDIPPPPPVMTPPPDYAAIMPNQDPNRGLVDYFQRLHQAEQEYDQNTRGNARVDVPLTPGGRVHRSIEIPRGFFPGVEAITK
ncbi:hypothetical protein LOZ65_001202 [Ophidiomyces ophidiicola]|nr:hypothetical protein LOZ65_001202 [Ophidiomyces ophidiicola]